MESYIDLSSIVLSLKIPGITLKLTLSVRAELKERYNWKTYFNSFVGFGSFAASLKEFEFFYFYIFLFFNTQLVVWG